jgi:hypothetical protein
MTHTQETRSTQFEKHYWCANWTNEKCRSKGFSGFIVLKKHQFASKSVRMVQLVYQIGILTLIKIPNWSTTFRASHHRFPFWELCDVWLTSSSCTNLSSKLRYRRISMWIPNWWNKVHQNVFPKLGTVISILDRFQIGFFYEFGKTKPVLYFNKNIGADSIKRLYSIINSVFVWASFVCVYFSLLIRMKIPSLTFGNNRDKVRRCRCHQVYSGLLLTLTHSSVHEGTPILGSWH